MIKLEETIRSLLEGYDIPELELNPYWSELLDLYESTKKMLPRKYLETLENLDLKAIRDQSKY